MKSRREAFREVLSGARMARPANAERYVAQVASDLDISDRERAVLVDGVEAISKLTREGHGSKAWQVAVEIAGRLAPDTSGPTLAERDAADAMAGRILGTQPGHNSAQDRHAAARMARARQAVDRQLGGDPVPWQE